MKRVALALSMAGLAAACAVPAKNMDRVQAGMSRDQVQSIMGQPIAVAQHSVMQHPQPIRGLWRAGCVDRTSGSGGGPQKRAG